MEIALQSQDGSTEQDFSSINSCSLGLAVENHDVLTVKLILSRAHIDNIPVRLLTKAAHGNNKELFKILFEQDVAGISGRSDFGLVIGALSRPGKETLLKEVLDAAKLTRKQLTSMTKYHRGIMFSAAKDHHLSSLELLLSYEAIASEAAELRPESALHYACSGDSESEVIGIIGLLVKHGIPLNSESKEILPPLQHALLHGNVVAAVALLKWGANAESAGKKVLSSLHYVAMHKNLQASFQDISNLVDVLVRRGADLNRLSHSEDLPEGVEQSDLFFEWREQLEDYQATPLFFAALNDTSKALFNKLLDSGASATSTIIYKKSPMCLIAGLVRRDNGFHELFRYHSAARIFSLLMKHGARLDDRCGRDWGSALDRACHLSRGLRACCVKLNKGPCGVHCGKAESKLLQDLLQYAPKEALSVEHAYHHLRYYHVKVKGDHGPRQWICRPFKQPPRPGDIETDFLREFVETRYIQPRHIGSPPNYNTIVEPSTLNSFIEPSTRRRIWEGI